MNNIPYMYPNNFEQCILNELKRLNETLKEIETQLRNNNSKENNYLQKDNTYHMI